MLQILAVRAIFVKISTNTVQILANNNNSNNDNNNNNNDNNNSNNNNSNNNNNNNALDKFSAGKRPSMQ